MENNMTIYQNNLHFLRFVLASLVILGHAYILIDPNYEQSYIGQFFFSTFSALSVHAFFIISGYLIYNSIINTKLYKQYVTKRLLRILPLFYIVLLVSLPLCSFFYSNAEGTDNYWGQKSTWNYLLNNLTVFRLMHTIDGVFSHNPHPAINGSLWSIPYEVMCYIAFSVLFIFKKSSPKTMSIWMVVGYIVSIILCFQLSLLSDTFRTLSTCFLLFYTGMMIARFLNPKKIPLLIALLCFILFIIFYYCREWLPDARWRMVSIFPFSIFIMFVAFVPNKILPKFAQWGDASYGIYLLGFPIQQTLIALYPSWHPLHNFIIAYLIVVPLAFISWHFLEKPILGLKTKI
jgi:peptidoglycan/LPS O-acetylase OafA/YrhL